MNDKIIHFKTAKKQLNYARKEAQASENRVKFGQSKTQTRKTKFVEFKAKKHLDGHELTDE